MIARTLENDWGGEGSTRCFLRSACGRYGRRLFTRDTTEASAPNLPRAHHQLVALRAFVPEAGYTKGTIAS